MDSTCTCPGSDRGRHGLTCEAVLRGAFGSVGNAPQDVLGLLAGRGALVQGAVEKEPLAVTAGDDGWEERMAARAKARQEEREAAERAREEANDPHAGHHGHLIGTAVYCSCGEFEGITCVAFPGATREEWEALGAVSRCEACGQRGVSGLMPQGWEPSPVPPSGLHEAIAGMLGDLMWRKAYSRTGELDSPSGR